MKKIDNKIAKKRLEIFQREAERIKMKYRKNFSIKNLQFFSKIDLVGKKMNFLGETNI